MRIRAMELTKRADEVVARAAIESALGARQRARAHGLESRDGAWRIGRDGRWEADGAADAADDEDDDMDVDACTIEVLPETP